MFSHSFLRILWFHLFGHYRLYLQLFVGGLIYIIWVCLRIMVCSLFCLSSSCVLCSLCCQFLWIVHFALPLLYSLTFIRRTIYTTKNKLKILHCCWWKRLPHILIFSTQQNFYHLASTDIIMMMGVFIHVKTYLLHCTTFIHLLVTHGLCITSWKVAVYTRGRFHKKS